MALVKARCTNCEGILEVDSTKDAAICPYCGTPYIVEKAIQQYTINNTNYIENASFASETEYQKLLNAAEGFMKLGKYSDAYGKYGEITKDYPQEFEGWWGLYRASKAEVLDDEDTKKHNSTPQNYLDGAVATAKKLANPDQLRQINSYISKIEALFEKRSRCFTEKYPDLESLYAFLANNNLKFAWTKTKGVKYNTTFKSYIVPSKKTGKLILFLKNVMDNDGYYHHEKWEIEKYDAKIGSFQLGKGERIHNGSKSELRSNPKPQIWIVDVKNDKYYIDGYHSHSDRHFQFIKQGLFDSLGV